MFSNNGKISIRQVYRLFLFDFLGVGSLIIPTILARLVGSLGWLCIILGIGMGLVFLALIAYEQSHIRTQNIINPKLCFQFFRHALERKAILRKLRHSHAVKHIRHHTHRIFPIHMKKPNTIGIKLLPYI